MIMGRSSKIHLQWHTSSGKIAVLHHCSATNTSTAKRHFVPAFLSQDRLEGSGHDHPFGPYFCLLLCQLPDMCFRKPPLMRHGAVLRTVIYCMTCNSRWLILTPRWPLSFRPHVKHVPVCVQCVQTLHNIFAARSFWCWQGRQCVHTYLPCSPMASYLCHGSVIPSHGNFPPC